MKKIIKEIELINLDPGLLSVFTDCLSAKYYYKCKIVFFETTNSENVQDNPALGK